MSSPTTPLSEKAQGKQRVRDPVDESWVSSPSTSGPSTVLRDDERRHSTTSATAPPPILRTAVVRFTDSAIPDLALSVRPKDVVQFLKTKIREQRPQLQNKRLRLILNGRLIMDAHVLYDSLDDHGQKWIHCSVGAQLEEGQHDSDNGKVQVRVYHLCVCEDLPIHSYSSCRKDKSALCEDLRVLLL